MTRGPIDGETRARVSAPSIVLVPAREPREKIDDGRFDDERTDDRTRASSRRARWGDGETRAWSRTIGDGGRRAR